MKCKALVLVAIASMLALSLTACGNASTAASGSSAAGDSASASAAASGAASESASESASASDQVSASAATQESGSTADSGSASAATQESSSTAAEDAGATGDGTASNVDYADYAGYQFLGNDPWDGKLTITVKYIADNTMTWTFTDAFEDHTLYKEIEGTPLDNGVAAFDIQGADVEHDNVTFAYKGSLELKDGKVAVTFDSGQVATASPQGGDSYRFAEALADSGLSNQVILDRVADGPYEPYIVQEGDSLHSIAEAHGISTKDLVILNQVAIAQAAQDNGLHYDNPADYAKHLFPGEELLVPRA